MIKTLVFDLDGTLANTERLHYRAWKETLTANGVSEFSIETFMTFVGTSNEKVAGDYIRKEKIGKTIPQVVREKQAVYMDLIPEIKLFAGARDILIRYHGTYRLTLASSSHKKEILTLLKLHRLDTFFELIIGGDMVKRKKPDPEIYLKVQQEMSVKPHECIAFEDSEHGLNSAKYAGVYGVAIPNEFTRDHNFSRADLILDSLHAMNDKKITSLQQSPP